MESKLIKAKKAQKLNKGITVAVTVIISVVVLFTLFADLIPEAQSAGDEFSDDNKCVEAGCIVNNTFSNTCRNDTIPTSEACTFDIETVPLASLFGGSSVIILLLMVTLFLGIISLVMPKSRK